MVELACMLGVSYGGPVFTYFWKTGFVSSVERMYYYY